MQLLLSLPRDVMKGVSEGNSKYAEKIATCFSKTIWRLIMQTYEALINWSIFYSDLPSRADEYGIPFLEAHRRFGVVDQGSETILCILRICAIQSSAPLLVNSNTNFDGLRMPRTFLPTKMPLILQPGSKPIVPMKPAFQEGMGDVILRVGAFRIAIFDGSTIRMAIVRIIL
jgi:hypothetical protein